MNRVKTVFAAFREMNRLEKRIIPTAVTVAFVTAVMPFINIWFTSKIIDLLDGGAGKVSHSISARLSVLTPYCFSSTAFSAKCSSFIAR